MGEAEEVIPSAKVVMEADLPTWAPNHPPSGERIVLDRAYFPPIEREVAGPWRMSYDLSPGKPTKSPKHLQAQDRAEEQERGDDEDDEKRRKLAAVWCGKERPHVECAQEGEERDREDREHLQAPPVLENQLIGAGVLSSVRRPKREEEDFDDGSCASANRRDPRDIRQQSGNTQHGFIAVANLL